MDEPKVTIEDREKDEPLENTRMKITLEVERIFDPNRSKNNLMMTMAAGATFTDPDTEEEVGEIVHCIPTHTVIRDNVTKEDWLVNYGDLFGAYIEAREELEEEEEAPEEDVILKVDELDPDNDKVGC